MPEDPPTDASGAATPGAAREAVGRRRRAIEPETTPSSETAQPLEKTGTGGSTESVGEQWKPAKTHHEIGRRTYIIADVEPLDVDGIRTVQVGSALWLLAFVALLPFYQRLADSGREWWLWTCLTGFAIGIFGNEWARRRRNQRSRGGGRRAG